MLAFLFFLFFSLSPLSFLLEIASVRTRWAKKAQVRSFFFFLGVLTYMHTRIYTQSDLFALMSE